MNQKPGVFFTSRFNNPFGWWPIAPPDARRKLETQRGPYPDPVDDPDEFLRHVQKHPRARFQLGGFSFITWTANGKYPEITF